MNGFGLFGIVKENGVDDDGLFSFHRDFFNYPLFRDDKLEFYNALGGRKLGITSLFGMLWNGSSIKKRWEDSNITGENLKGEGLKQGGVIVFGKDGKPKYAYEEVTGTVVPTDDLLAALRAVKEEQS